MRSLCNGTLRVSLTTLQQAGATQDLVQQMACKTLRDAGKPVTLPAQASAANSIRYAAVAAFRNAPSWSIARSFGMLSSNYNAVMVNSAGVAQSKYVFEVQGANCRSLGRVQRCTYMIRAQVQAGAFGQRIMSYDGDWIRRTDDFTVINSTYSSTTLKKFMEDWASDVNKRTSSPSTSKPEEPFVPFSDIQGCSIGFNNICPP